MPAAMRREMVAYGDIFLENTATTSRGEKALNQDGLERDMDVLRSEVAALRSATLTQFLAHFDANFVATGRMKDIVSVAKRAAETDKHVLIEGESGTGKRLLAHAIHHWSSRAHFPLISVVCGMFPETLFEEVLFGSERPTARTTLVGHLELANSGTVILEKISAMSLSIQSRLLIMLQDGGVQRNGGKEAIRVDLRFISSTNTDLERAVMLESFSEDLLKRLSVCHLKLPPLRERPEDISPLAQLFLSKQAGNLVKRRLVFSQRAFQAMTQYKWPGNVRELENRVTRAAILASGNEIGREELFPDADSLQ